MNYGYSKNLSLPFPEAVERVRAELANEGFGVITEIDVKETLKKKLGIDYDAYVILGACNPPLAYQALQLEKEIGLLLPCNVIVYENRGKVVISSIIPTATMSRIANPSFLAIAIQVEQKLKKVIDAVGNTEKGN